MTLLLRCATGAVLAAAMSEFCGSNSPTLLGRIGGAVLAAVLLVPPILVVATVIVPVRHAVTRFLHRRQMRPKILVGLVPSALVGVAVAIAVQRSLVTFHNPEWIATMTGVIAAAATWVSWVVLERVPEPAWSGKLFVALGVLGSCSALFVPRSVAVLLPLDLRWFTTSIAILLGALSLAHRLTWCARKERSIMSAACVGYVSLAFLLPNLAAIRKLVAEHEGPAAFALMQYARASDFDRDGFAAIFTGQDCDDFDATIHPGATDLERDGVDRNCNGLDADRVQGNASLSQIAYPFQPNILLITVDALRADAELPRTSAALAWQKYSDASTVSPRTTRAIPALMTGRFPSDLQLYEYGCPDISEHEVMLAERLRDAGYRTAAVVGTDYFRVCNGYFQGFEQTWQHDQYQATTQVAAQVLTELAATGVANRPSFIWVHGFWTHSPYLVENETATASILYHRAVAFADGELARMIAGIDRERTIVILTADHGEGLFEHQNPTHGRTLYQEELQIPLWIYKPTALNDTRDPDLNCPVALIDVFPTLTRFLPTTDSFVSGSDLFEDCKERTLVAQILPDAGFWDYAYSIRRGAYKYIWWPRTGREQLFDLVRDEDERRDLVVDQVTRTTQMRSLLVDWIYARRTVVR